MTRGDPTSPRPPAPQDFAPVEVGARDHEDRWRAGVTVRKLAVGPYDNNVYVVASGGQAILVDGAAEPERILAEVAGLQVVAIVQTHGHVDHIQALPRLVEALDTAVLAPPAGPWPGPLRPVRGRD